jgi:hypothetical protein
MDTYSLVHEFWRVKALAKYHAECEDLIKENPAHAKLFEIQERQVRRFIRHVAIGIYDDYGSIEGFDNEDSVTRRDWMEFQFMIHRKAAELFLGESLDPNSLFDQLDRLVEKCFSARIQLFGHHLIGAQHFDREELALQELVIEATQLMINEKKEYIRINWDEDDEGQ